MARYRLGCARGHHSLVTVRTRWGLALPAYFLADETQSDGRTDKVERPTIVCGRGSWDRDDTAEASAAAWPQASQEFQRAACPHEPSYRVRGLRTDGCDSTVKSLRPLFPGAGLGDGLGHASTKLPGTLAAIASPVRKAVRSRFHTRLYRARQRKGWRGFALGQRVRHCADHVAHTAGTANGARVRRWVRDKQAGWSVVLADPQLPGTTTLLDQAHNAIERQLGAMQGFQHPTRSQQALLVGLAHLYHLVPSHRRAPHAGPCGVAVAGGRVPTADWFLTRQLLASGGFRCAGTHATTPSDGM
jgi:hypothetical protein